ncbi:preprotein translocase subunit SecG [Candidatus Sumerlaeota bacterium]|nr:preprotein translocase subunit SecG [Candidatus Sumerlaeota bacterium]
MGFGLTILLIGYVFICLFLILLILMQAGKGGGLSGLVGGSALADTFGATGAEKTLSRWTTYLAIVFFVLSIGLTILGARHFRKSSLLEELQKEEARATQTAPASAVSAPTPIQVEQTSPEKATEPTAPASTKQAQIPGEDKSTGESKEKSQPQGEVIPVIPRPEQPRPASPLDTQ